MRVLILSSSTGAGHDSCANAIKEVFDSSGEYCEVAEALNFISKGVAVVMTKGHTVIYRHFPYLFKFGYEFFEKHQNFYSKGTLTDKFLSSGGGKLGEYIKNGDFDTVICTHPFSTVMLAAAIQKYGLKLKTAFVATDYTCAPTVDAKSMDVYFVPDDAITDAFVKYGMEKEKIIPSGIPVRQMFYNHLSKEDAKSKAGIKKDSTHLLIMCGSMGCGPIKKIVDNISVKLPENTEITVVCGTNKRLRKSLSKKYGLNSSVHIKGFVKDMSALLDSAELYLTKPGGLSVSEAKQKSLPMVFINAVAGCEEYNRMHFVNLGAAAQGNSVKELSLKCLEILNDAETLNSMTEILVNEEKINASKYIREYLENKKIG